MSKSTALFLIITIFNLKRLKTTIIGYHTSFLGNKYNIPITIVLPLNYPYSPPIVTVNPTASMRYAPNHPNVDSNGNVRHEYLSDWKVFWLLTIYSYVTVHNIVYLFLSSFSRTVTSRLLYRSSDSCFLRGLLYMPFHRAHHSRHLRLSHTHFYHKMLLSLVCLLLFVSFKCFFMFR